MATIFEASYEQLKDAQAEIERLRAARSEAINTLSDPCDACDFDDGEIGALRATIQQALMALARVDEQSAREG